MTLSLTFARPTEHTPISGMLLGGIAFALLTTVDTIFKLIAEGHPPYQILLVNGLFAVVPVILWALLTGGFERLGTARPGLQLLRGSISVMSGLAAIYAYSRLPLTSFYTIVFTGPLMVAALSAFWLGEKIEPIRWIAIVCGFAGVLVAMDPLISDTLHHGHSVLVGRAAAFVSVFCYTLSVIMIRRMRLGESNIAFSFWGYIACTLIGSGLWLIWGAPPLAISDYAHLMMSGLCAGIASICLMTAYHRSPVAVVAPFQYSQIFWGAVAGFIFWHSVPSSHLIFGAIIVAASGLFVIHREIRAKGADLSAAPIQGAE